MDKYKKLMCVKGLIMSLDEQIYRIDNNKIPASPEDYKITLNQYYKSIIEFLDKEDTDEKTS